MPVYHLRCVYDFTDGRCGSAFGHYDIEASTTEDARERALALKTDKANMYLVSAVLTAPDGSMVWQHQSPMGTDRVSEFGNKLVPGAGT